MQLYDACSANYVSNYGDFTTKHGHLTQVRGDVGMSHASLGFLALLGVSSCSPSQNMSARRPCRGNDASRVVLPWISGSVRYDNLHGQSFCRWTMSFWHKNGLGSRSSWLSRAETRSVFPHVKQLPSPTSIDLVMSSMDRPWIAPPRRTVILAMAVRVHVT